MKTTHKDKMAGVTQCKRLLGYLKQYKTITFMQGLNLLGIMNMKGRIFDLRQAGHDIKTKFIPVKNRFGEICRVAEYRFFK